MSRPSSQYEPSKAAVLLTVALVTGVAASRIRGAKWLLLAAGLGGAAWSLFGTGSRRRFTRPEITLVSDGTTTCGAGVSAPVLIEGDCDPFQGPTRPGMRCGHAVEIEAEDLTGLGAGRSADWLLGSEPTLAAEPAGETVIEGEAAEMMQSPPPGDPVEIDPALGVSPGQVPQEIGAASVNEGSEIPDEVMIDPPLGKDAGASVSTSSPSSVMAPWGECWRQGAFAAGAVARDGAGPAPPKVPRHLVPRAPSGEPSASLNESSGSSREG